MLPLAVHGMISRRHMWCEALPDERRLALDDVLTLVGIKDIQRGRVLNGEGLGCRVHVKPIGLDMYKVNVYKVRACLAYYPTDCIKYPPVKNS